MKNVLGKLVSDLQENVAVNGNAITGTLHYVDNYTGFNSDDEEQQSGNYIVLNWSVPQEGVTSLKIGLQSSNEEEGLIECIEDDDNSGVFRITDTTQKFVIKQTRGSEVKTQEFSLSGLVLESE